jgi:hypothetical protein
MGCGELGWDDLATLEVHLVRGMAREGGVRDDGIVLFDVELSMRACTRSPLPVPRLSSPASSVLRSCPTSRARSSQAIALGLPFAVCRHPCARRARDLPAPVRDASVRAWGLRPRRASYRLAIARELVLPSAYANSVGTQKLMQFRGSIAQPARAPVNASPLSLRADQCMTRGRSGSLFLLRMASSSMASRRFLPAHLQLHAQNSRMFRFGAGLQVCGLGLVIRGNDFCTAQ